MTNYIFDWDDNSRTVLQTNRYSTLQFQYKEQMALIAYLLRGTPLHDGSGDRLFRTEGELYDIWKSIPSRLLDSLEDEEERKQKFEELLDKAYDLNENLPNLYVEKECIHIYQEELDFINSMEVLPWLKQLIATMLCVYKFYGKEWCGYNQRLRAFVYSTTDIKRSRESATNNNNSQLAQCLSKYKPYEMKVQGDRVFFKITFGRKDGKLAALISTPREVDFVHKKLKNEKTCTQCGKVWTYNSHTFHSELCPECALQVKRQASQKCHKRSCYVAQKAYKKRLQQATDNSYVNE